MKTLILFGTSEGHSKQIANRISEVIANEGCQIEIESVSERNKHGQPPNAYDLVIIGGSVHMYSFNKSMVKYIAKNSASLNDTYSAFFSVSMLAASKDENDHQQIERLAQKLMQKTNWKPQQTINFPGALKFTSYSFFKKWLMKMITKKQGGGIDTNKDHDFTNWEEVEDFAKSLVKQSIKTT